MELHRFKWLNDVVPIGALAMRRWNHLVDRQHPQIAVQSAQLHRTLGGLWFRDQRGMGRALAAEWFGARDDAMRLWD
jgi:hypothetical protein